MAQIEITSQNLIVHITGMDRLWALKSHLDIPLSHVAGATPAGDEASAWLKETHIAGTHVPGILSAGAFHRHGDRVFWDVHDPAKAIAIELKDDHFARLVVEVDDTTAAIAMINHAMPVLVAPK